MMYWFQHAAVWNLIGIRRGDRRKLVRRQAVLDSLSQAVATASDLRELQLRLASEFCSLGRVERTAFLAHDLLGNGYREVSGVGSDQAGLFLDARGPLIKWLEVNEELIAFPDQGDAHDVPDVDERGALERHSVRACVPLVSVSRLVGVIVLCSPRRAWRLTRADRAFLNACARQAALACDAADRRGRLLTHVEARHRARQLDLAGRLAAVMAHEVRNPLAAMRSTLQLARSTGARRMPESLVDDALAQIDRIDEAMAGMLRLSRPDETERVEVDLVSAVEEALGQLDLLPRSSTVAVSPRLDARPLPVLGDAAELRSLFLNLLVNACNGMPGGGQLTIRSALVAMSPSGGSLSAARIDIEDTGTGMPSEVLARVFEPFYTTRPTGTGLGLPIWLEIVHRHGGELRLASEPGRGTVATVLLPMRPVL